MGKPPFSDHGMRWRLSRKRNLRWFYCPRFTYHGRQHLQPCSECPQIACKVLGMSKVIDGRPFTHPYVRSKTIPPSRPPFLGARRRVAVKDGRKAIAKRREASFRATRRLATLAAGGGASIMLPLPAIPTGSGSGSGKPSKSVTAFPSIIALPLTEFLPVRHANRGAHGPVLPEPVGRIRQHEGQPDSPLQA